MPEWRESALANAQEAAAKGAQEREVVHLSRSKQVFFVTALLEPRSPSARLRQAASHYRQRLACS